MAIVERPARRLAGAAEADMRLYDPARHEPLAPEAWSEARARTAIAAIVDDAEAAYTPKGLWPIHPLDVSEERPPDCMKPIYHGAGGVIWTLRHLQGVGAVRLRRDYGPTAARLIDRNRDDLARHPGVAAYMGGEQPAFLVGEAGLRLLEWSIAPTQAGADALAEAVASRIGDVRGLAWGGAGAMLAATFMHEWTGEPRWGDLFCEHFDALWAAWTRDTETMGWLWDQSLYGVTEKRLGALHGFAGNAIAIIKGRPLVGPARYAKAIALIVATALATARLEPDGCNWPHAAGAEPLRLQHCIGAPGMVTALAEIPGRVLDELLNAAGELIWRAGPPVKLPSLCHGAPGNGYAFLKLYARTGDVVWLARARAFAMHAIGQADRALAQHGQRKYSLWTGDLGVALLLWACIAADARFPTIDIF
jgi:hypothetical protein